MGRAFEVVAVEGFTGGTTRKVDLFTQPMLVAVAQIGQGKKEINYGEAHSTATCSVKNFGRLNEYLR